MMEQDVFNTFMEDGDVTMKRRGIPVFSNRMLENSQNSSLNKRITFAEFVHLSQFWFKLSESFDL